MDSGTGFVAVDNSNTNKLTMHMLAAVVSHEREPSGERTRIALEIAKTDVDGSRPLDLKRMSRTTLHLGSM